MEWFTCIKEAINYIEKNLFEIKRIDQVAVNCGISTIYLQQGFQIMTGYSIAEYIRNRKLYLAGLELLEKDKKIIDVAFEFGYETPESFTKAFSRFHGFSPSKVKINKNKLHIFNPIVLNHTIEGGPMMKINYKIVKMFPMKVLGFCKEFNYDNSYEMIPKFWDEICEKYANNIYAGNEPRNEYEKAIIDNCIGEYGICIDDLGNGKFRYLIAGKYTGGNIPKGMVLYEFPSAEWAVFDCIGAIPEALQKLNTFIFREWLPGNKEYEISGNANVEWYDCMNGEKTDPDYHTQIWIPVKKINK